MGNTVESRVLGGSAASAVSFAMYFAQNVLLVPLLLHYWGPDRYGSWLSLFALYALLQSIDIGHQSYMGNEFCKQYATDRKYFREILGASLRVSLVLGCAQLLVAGVLIWPGSVWQWFGLGAELLKGDQEGLSLIVLLGGWILYGSVAGVLVKLYAPAGNLARGIWWGIFVRLVQTIALGITAWSGGGLLAAAVSFSIVSALINFSMILDLRRQFHDIWPFWSMGNWKLGWQNVSRSLIISGNQGLTQLQQTGVIVKIASILGNGLVPVFTTVRTLSNTFAQIANIIVGPVVPEMIRYHAHRDPRKLLGVVSTSWWATGIITNLGLLVTLPAIPVVYRIWTRGKIPFGLEIYMLLAWAVSLKNYGNPLTSYLTGINHLRAQAIITVVQTAVVLIGTGLLLNRIGILAAGVAIIVGEIMGSVVIPTVFISIEWRRMGGAFPTLHACFAMGATTMVGLIFLCVAMGVFSPSIGGMAGGGLLCILYVWQWVNLSKEVRNRVSGLFSIRVTTS